MIATREEIHHLVDQLPADQLAAAARYLEYLRDTADPLWHALLNAPIDDEPLTSEEEAAIAEGLKALHAGHVVSAEEIEREFGPLRRDP